MALAIKLPATRVQAPIESPLLGLGDVATIFGCILVQAVLLTSKLGVVVRRLPRIDLAVRDAANANLTGTVGSDEARELFGAAALQFVNQGSELSAGYVNPHGEAVN